MSYADGGWVGPDTDTIPVFTDNGYVVPKRDRFAEWISADEFVEEQAELEHRQQIRDNINKGIAR